MTTTTWYSTTLTAIECGSCGIPFGLPESFQRKMVQEGTWFYCPNGHRIHYGDFDNARLRRENERLRTRAVHLEDQRDAAERSARAYRGHLTRLRSRIRNGVCPWCNRHFADVMRHVSSKHPEHQEKAQEATA